MLSCASIAVLSTCLLAPIGTEIDLQPPGPGVFILDQADLISADDETAIRSLCSGLLADKSTPIMVVTIDSMATYVQEGTRIESFATLLFNQWQIGHAKLHGKDWNTGMLLLVAKSDRKARIELGAGWHHDKDIEAQRIMNELIIPKFKAGDFSGGIRSGVVGLEQVGRGFGVPRPASPWWHYAIAAGCVVLGLFTVISMARDGTNGAAWLFWVMLFSILGFILMTLLTPRRRYYSNGLYGGGYGGGGYGGGGFSGGGGGGGGGFSGGGGATGSW